MAHIQFTRNTDDLSTDKGFQFKFHCDQCHNGYMSSYKTNPLGVAGSLLSAAGSLFGGVLGRASHGAYEINRAVGGKAHDDALQEAVAEMKPKFRHCTRCGHWVCPEACWNEKRTLCEACAPDVGEEAAAIQAQVAREQLWEKARKIDLVKDVDMAQDAVGQCPKCGARAGAAKFCAECGAALSPKVECAQCGTEMDRGAKFCPECGARTVGR